MLTVRLSWGFSLAQDSIMHPAESKEKVSFQDGQISPEVEMLTPVKSVSSSSSDYLAPAENPPFKLTDWLFRRGSYKPINIDTIATKQSVYDDPTIATHYWPKPTYENIHRFDPKARWTYREERVSKIQFIFNAAFNLL